MKKMTQTFIKKNIKLLTEFDRYMMQHRQVRDAIPYGATLVLAVTGDEAFNKTSRAMIAGATGKRAKLVEVRKEGSRWIVRPLKKIEQATKE